MAVVLFATFTLFSCSSNEEASTAKPEFRLPESAKSPEVITFRNAFVASIKAKSRSGNSQETSAEIAKSEAEMTESSKTFLEANGFFKIELQTKEAPDPSEIRRMALALLAKKTAIIFNN